MVQNLGAESRQDSQHIIAIECYLHLYSGCGGALRARQIEGMSQLQFVGAERQLPSFTISYDADPAEMQRKIEETSPYKVVKVKMGLDHDKEIVEIGDSCAAALMAQLVSVMQPSITFIPMARARVAIW